MNRLLPVLVVAIAASLGVPHTVLAQRPEAVPTNRIGLSLWAGGVTDGVIGSWLVSPQVGIRGEVRAAGPLWLGVQVDTWILEGANACPGDPYSLALYAPCDRGGLDLRPIASAQSRLELGGEQLRPYVVGSVGRTRNTGLWSLGAGARLSRGPRGSDLSAELRHRSSDLFSNLGYHHWEFVVGVQLR
jgi:hypothetical protein